MKMGFFLRVIEMAYLNCLWFFFLFFFKYFNRPLILPSKVWIRGPEWVDSHVIMLAIQGDHASRWSIFCPFTYFSITILVFFHIYLPKAHNFHKISSLAMLIDFVRDVCTKLLNKFLENFNRVFYLDCFGCLDTTVKIGYTDFFGISAVGSKNFKISELRQTDTPT